MGWRSRATAIAVMSLGFFLLAQESPSTPQKPAVCDPDSLGADTGLEVVSDLGGVDFTKYLADLLVTVRKNWPAVIPIEARPPAKKKGCSAIEFSVLSNGDVGGLRVTASSGDEKLDRASWLAISSSAPFAPLPRGYPHPEIVLRFHFFYNPDPGVAKRALTEGMGVRTSVTASVVSLTGGTTSPQTLYAPLPSYTERAIQGQRRGTVLISLVVNKKGGVSHVQVVHGIDHDLDREARKAIKTWKFQPQPASGEDTEVPVNVEVRFNLK